MWVSSAGVRERVWWEMGGSSGRLIAAMGFADGVVIGLRVRIRLAMSRSCPPLEVGTTTLGSGTRHGSLGVLVGNNSGIALGIVFAGCGRSLDSWNTLRYGA